MLNFVSDPEDQQDTAETVEQDGTSGAETDAEMLGLDGDDPLPPASEL